MSSNPLGMRQQGVGRITNMLNRHAVGTSAVQLPLKFTNGGRPVGRPSIVGERGAELFVPDGQAYYSKSSVRRYGWYKYSCKRRCFWF